MARILIAGCGDVGSRLGERLVAAGHQVWGLRRRVDRLPTGLKPLAADLTDPSTYRQLLPDRLDSVCFTAAPDRRTEETYRRTYVDSLSHLISELEGKGQDLSSLIFTSSTGVYGQDDGQWLDETSATRPQSFTGQLLLEAEQVLAAAPWKSISLRLGGIYGPNRTRLVRMAREGNPIRRNPFRFSNRIHVDDCARALEHLLKLDRPAPVYVGVDHAPVQLSEVLDWICAELGLPPLPPLPQAQTPQSPESQSPELQSPESQPALPPENEQNLGKRCSSALLLASGFEFQFPTYREGYGAFLRQH